MIRFVRAHGYDAGPTQRPLLAGALSGALAIAPAAPVLVGLGSFQVAAHDVMRVPVPLAALAVGSAFVAAGLLYGAFFQRAANDRRAGWLLGMSYGFAIWMTAPVFILPWIGGRVMAAGLPATGFFLAFLLWGLILGVVFPFVHRPLHAQLSDGPRSLGPDAVTVRRRLFRRAA
jgi:hypothetical protein